MDRDARVEDVDGTGLAGDGRDKLAIHTREPLAAGAYRLVVGTELEDLAGNSVAQPFEVDAAGPITKRVTSKTVALPFEIGSPAPDGSRVASRARVAQPVVEIRWA